MLNLGIVADEIERDFAKAVAIGKRVDITRYEIRFLTTGRAPMCAISELARVEKIAHNEGVTITALSPGLFKWTDTQEAFAKEMAEVYPRAVEWAHRWHLPGLIVFGFHKPGATEESGPRLSSKNPSSQVLEQLAQAGERAAKDGLVLMIEPEVVCWADSGIAAVELIRRAGSTGLAINYDPGNVAWAQGRDPLDEFDRMAPLIANVHVKDLRPAADPAERPTFLPAGEGIIDFKAHFASLRGFGYKGPISLEPHMDGSEATIRRCREAALKCW